MLLMEWLGAERKRLDIWEVELEVFADGNIQHICEKKKKVLEKNKKKELKMEVLMINYLGLGLDGKIAMDCEQQRTNVQCINNFSYCLNGFKNIFKSNPTIADLLENIHEGETTNKIQTDYVLSQQLLLSHKSNKS